MKSREGAHTTHLDTFITVFAPSNDAMEAFAGDADENLILNHMGELPDETVPSRSGGNFHLRPIRTMSIVSPQFYLEDFSKLPDKTVLPVTIGESIESLWNCKVCPSK